MTRTILSSLGIAVVLSGSAGAPVASHPFMDVRIAGYQTTRVSAKTNGPHRKPKEIVVVGSKAKKPALNAVTGTQRKQRGQTPVHMFKKPKGSQRSKGDGVKTYYFENAWPMK